MTENPWRQIEAPNQISAVNARRVDADVPWDFFWARAADRKVMLILGHEDSASPVSALPLIRGIDVTVSEADQHGFRTLGLKLQDSAQQDIFHTLCLDIVSAAALAESEADAVATTLRRTWRWHHLLQGGRSGRLSNEEQKGLIGELLVFERFLLPVLPATLSLAAWLGPLGSPKDFEVGGLAIEAKARRGGASPTVAITSEHQLDSSGLDALFLHVVDLNISPHSTADGFSVEDLAAQIRSQIVVRDPEAALTFDELLAAAGLREEDSYADSLWVEGKTRIYDVGAGFPKITAASIPSGVERVRYSVALSHCDGFEVLDSELIEAIERLGEPDANGPG